MELYNFLDKKLAELRNEKFAEFKKDDTGLWLDDALLPEHLEGMKDELLELNCFKNTKELNIVNLPAFLVDDNTGTPIGMDKDFVGTNKKRVVTVGSINITDDDFEFGEYVDLYTITKSPINRYGAVNEKPGVWVYPSLTSPESFEPYKKIEVIWNPEQLQDSIALEKESNEDFKQRLIRMFTNAVENMEVNLPENKSVLVRMSPRSIKSEKTIS